MIIEQIYRFTAKDNMDGWDEEFVAELIRCKDCMIAPICIMYRNAQQDDGYCSWAERKD